LLFIAGLGTGFVLGSRAGRRAYEQLRSRVQDVSRSPAVQTTVGKARELAEQKAPKLTGAVTALGGTATKVTESVHQAGEQAVVPVPETSTDVLPVGAEATGTDAAGGTEIGEGSSDVGPVGTEATTREGDDVER
jgi:hypothetical protein